MIDISEYTMTNLLNNMLSRIPDTLDKREGSIIYDALAPAAWELSAAYTCLAQCMAQSFAATATGEFLEQHGSELGLSRAPAVKAVRLASFADSDGDAMAVPLGARFATLNGVDSLNFCVLSEESAGVYRLEAETAGSVGNEYVGALLPITHIEGLGSATMYGSPVTAGAEAESDESLRARYFAVFGRESKNGNAAQYAQWAAEFDGVGRARVFPAWNGANTVKVSILGSDQGVADAALIAAFQDYLDPDGDGLGAGMAPIGASVTVTTATPLTVNVAASVTLTSGYDSQQAQAAMESAVQAYFAAIAYSKPAVNSIEIGAAALALPAVAAVSSLTVNGGANVALATEQIPVLGTLTLEVAS